uniref:trypsin-like serine protease n=1 Tax=Thaumasiovibrio occultus TaxID=1891184 RepID=UPI000B35B26C|nr:trypsin-like serine protease [Thaumasiovibrio occultus]
MAACYATGVHANDPSLGTDHQVMPKIVGGYVADPANWGFFTQIMRPNANRSFCGGSYLGDGYVLTAAHCVDGDSPSQLAVKVAGFEYNGQDGERANVTDVFLHPQFNSRNLDNDIAILKLDKVISNDKRVDIAFGSVSQYASIGDALAVAGMGRLTEGGNVPSRLMAVEVPLISDAECRTGGGSYNNVDAVSFCAGLPQGGLDSCQGDSGGPIVINQGGTITQLGIVSWGIGCARPGKYGVYSDIAALRDWVDSIVTLNADSVGVGYTKFEQIANVAPGEIVAHTFTVNNSGTTPFTVTQTALTAGGVATNAVIAQDTCTATTLLGGESCQVAAEFNAATTGEANVSLNFEIDQTTTSYVAQVSTQVVTVSEPGTCTNLWNADAVYTNGDLVSWQGQVWKALWWNQGADPSQSGPWGVWQVVEPASCDTGVAPEPTPEPTPDPTPEPDPTPQPPGDGNAYVAGAAYGPGDVVVHNGQTYQCRPWPNGLWCSASAYEPGVGDSWPDAWTAL